MDHSTPLGNFKKKKNNFLIIANIVLLLVVVSLTTYFLKDKLFSRNNQAAGPQSCPVAGYSTDCQSVSEPGACGNDEGNHCEGDQWCRAYRNEDKCYNNSSHSSVKWCCKGTDYNCSVVEGKCGVPGPTDTPSPTPTITVTPIPSPTPTGEISTPTPTSTVVPTPTDIIIEITPTITSTPTITPTPTIAQLICATKDCNETTRPCQSGNICIKANNGSNYCSNESLVDSCKSSPTESSCCKIVPTSNATPTEIILAKVSPTAVVKLPQTGVAKSFMFLIPATIMLLGFIL